jgi:hypothetical protein
VIEVDQRIVAGIQGSLWELSYWSGVDGNGGNRIEFRRPRGSASIDFPDQVTDQHVTEAIELLKCARPSSFIVVAWWEEDGECTVIEYYEVDGHDGGRSKRHLATGEELRS